jgi:hypothetical protein
MIRKKTLLGNYVRVLTGTLFATLIVINSLAQTGSSTIRGTVNDAQGAPVSGATVTATNEQQNSKRTSTTTSDGVYVFSQLSPGTYKVEVEGKGFKKSSAAGIKALVDSTIGFDFTLEVGGVNEVVTISSGSIENIVNTQDASLGNNFQSNQIQDIPIASRNVSDLLKLQGGVTEDGSVAGGRSDQANITLDGIDVNEQQTGEAFTPVLRVNPDTIEEFRVTTTNAEASKGRSSGAQISLITKTGTNSFRGNLYLINRPDFGAANDFFSNSAGTRDKLDRNQYGGSLGGPIKKDRLFFFYNYEALRQKRTVGTDTTVPLASLGQGIVKWRDATGVLQQLNTTQINALTTAGGLAIVNVNPLATALFAQAASKYPANNFRFGDGLNTGGYRFGAKLDDRENTHTATINWKVTNDGKHDVFLRGNLQSDLGSNTPAFPDTPTTKTWSHPTGFAARYQWIISNNLINSVSFGKTRLAFTIPGDDASNAAITFRDVYSPLNFSRGFSRVTPVTNISDDLSWEKGNHSLKFGLNFRFIRNKRTSTAALFASAITNQSFYQSSGAVVTAPVIAGGYTIGDSWTTSLRAALTAVFGRYSQYQATYNYGLDGNRLAANTPIVREFATEEYDFYAQDTWKVKSNLTISGGLRYGLSMPIYETQGYQAKPNVGLQEYFNKRVQAAAAGQNYTEPLSIVKAGQKNGLDNFYKLDKNNFQPSISVAWSPNFGDNWLGKLFGNNGDSVIRGGFRITNDYFGQALAVNFEGNNRLGFSVTPQIAANTYNVLDCPVSTATCRPGPLYTGPGQNIGALQGVNTGPTTLNFPQLQPSDGRRRIEGSLDSNLVSPINYSWTVSYGRKLPFGMYIDASYVGRIAKNLLASRDIFTPNNIKDPRSGQTWYEAAGILEAYRRNRTPISQIPNLPFFENLYSAGSLGSLLFGDSTISNTRAAYGFMATDDTPGCPSAPYFGCYQSGTDWTFLQDVLDGNTDRQLFYQKQYGALSAYGTIGSSNYHGAVFSIRQRHKGLSWDLNYTFSKSIDDASGLQTSGVYGSAFILNALRQSDNRAVSDFDIRHLINVNSVWELPVGKGRAFLGNASGFTDGLLGGWKMTGVFRYNTGYVADALVDVAGWPTNWNVRSNVVAIKKVKITQNATSGAGGVPNWFADRTAAYRSFRSPGPGESGDRNQLRYPGFIVLDLGLKKSINLPWKEGHKLSFSWEVFNVTNTQRFTGIADSTFGLDPDRNGDPSPTFGNFTGIQGRPRVMQFGIRYDF